MTASVFDRVFDLLTPLFANWGYLIIFAGTLLESIFLTGWIAPGTAVVLLGSFYAAQGGLNIYLVWSVAVAGALVGDNIGYLIGLKTGQRVKRKYMHRPRLRRGMEMSERWFSRYGGITVLFGRMVSGVDAFIPLTAGMGEMPYWRYLLYDLPGAMTWAALLSFLGYIFGDNWESIDRMINWLGWGLLGVIAAAAAVAYFIHRRRRGREAVASKEGGE